MFIATYTQQPNDQLDYDIPYDLVAGDSLSMVIATVTPVTSPPLIITESIITGGRVKLWVGGGVAPTTYKVTVKVTTSQGRVKEDEVKFKIKEY